MSCRNIDERLRELGRCGCRRCEDEYYYLQKDLNRYRSFRLSNYSPMCLPAQILTVEVPKEPKMEEPKNIAIKILVEKLKVEQSTLASIEALLKVHETNVKTYRDNKSKNQRAIKELTTALKKLGHKDA